MKKFSSQKTLFDELDTEESSQKTEIVAVLSDSIVSKFQNYKLDDYINDIETNGLAHTWSYICEYVSAHSAHSL